MAENSLNKTAELEIVLAHLKYTLATADTHKINEKTLNSDLQEIIKTNCYE